MCAAENATAGRGPGNFQGEEQRASGWATEEGRCGSTETQRTFWNIFLYWNLACSRVHDCV